MAARVTTTHPGGIVVERPMCVAYTGSMGQIREGHNVMGAPGPRPTWFFPAGDTTVGTDTYYNGTIRGAHTVIGFAP